MRIKEQDKLLEQYTCNFEKDKVSSIKKFIEKGRKGKIA